MVCWSKLLHGIPFAWSSDCLRSTRNLYRYCFTYIIHTYLLTNYWDLRPKNKKINKKLSIGPSFGLKRLKVTVIFLYSLYFNVLSTEPTLLYREFVLYSQISSNPSLIMKRHTQLRPSYSMSSARMINILFFIIILAYLDLFI